jgi:predicted secreted hydrolase
VGNQARKCFVIGLLLRIANDNGIGEFLSFFGVKCDFSSEWWSVSSKLPAKGREYGSNMVVLYLP